MLGLAHVVADSASPRLPHARLPGWLVGLALFVSACGDDKEPPPPLDPPALEIVALRAVGGGSWTPGSSKPLELGCAPSPVLVELGPATAEAEIDDWILRPPANCGGQRQCGFVSLTLDPSSDDATTVDSAATTVQVDISTAGEHVIVAEFRATDGSSPAPDGGRVISEQKLTVVVPSESDCAEDSDESPE